MNDNYFNTCNTLDEAAKLYKSLARMHHPDMQPAENKEAATRTMQDINGQYAEFCATFARNDGYRRQKEAHEQGKKSAADYHDLNHVAEELRRRILWALENLPGVDVELIGFWVWLTGNTYAHKDTIGKAGLGFEYSRAKKAWFYAGVPSFNKHHMKLDEIRSLHGSTKFTKDADEERQPAPAAVPAYV